MRAAIGTCGGARLTTSGGTTLNSQLKTWNILLK